MDPKGSEDVGRTNTSYAPFSAAGYDHLFR